MLPEQVLREISAINSCLLYCQSAVFSPELLPQERQYLVQHFRHKQAALQGQSAQVRSGMILKHAPMLRDGSLRASAEKGADR